MTKARDTASGIMSTPHTRIEVSQYSLSSQTGKGNLRNYAFDTLGSFAMRGLSGPASQFFFAVVEFSSGFAFSGGFTFRTSRITSSDFMHQLG